MPVLLVVLDHRGDRVTAPTEAEAVLPHITVGKSLDKVQPKHGRQAAQNTKNTPKSVNIVGLKLKMNCVTTQHKGISSKVMLLLVLLLELQTFPKGFRRHIFNLCSIVRAQWERSDLSGVMLLL